MAEASKQRVTHFPLSPRAKAEGAFLALAAGDALGWPQELRGRVVQGVGEPPVTTQFRAWVRRAGGRYYSHEEPIRAGEYSDDTQLALAVARCRRLGGTRWWHALTRTELPLWLLYERGGGGATKRAARLWRDGFFPWRAKDSRAVRQYFSAGGNGVAMRVLPHAIYHAGCSHPESLMHDVALDGVATHGHPRALVGAMAYAYAAWWLLRADRTLRFGELVRVLVDEAGIWGAFPASSEANKGWLDAANRSTANRYESEWRSVVGELVDLLERVRLGLDEGAIADDDEILRDLGCFSKSKGAGTVSTAAAVYLCARYAAQPVQGVLKAAFATGMDTDTVAAMSGGLLGCIAGMDWLPGEWTEVQDHDYLRRMAAEMVRGPSAKQNPAAVPQTLGRRQLDEVICGLVSHRTRGIELDGLRRADVIDSATLKPRAKSTFAHSWRLRVSDGQTIYVKKLGRRSSDLGRQEPRQLDLRAAEGEGEADPRTSSAAIAVGLGLSVANIESMASFFERAFGLRPTGDSDRPGLVSYGALSLVDQRGAGDRPSRLASEGSRRTNARRYRIQLRTDDLESAYGRVERWGGKLLGPITGTAKRERVFECSDPEGNLIEVAERI